ncbi:MAG: SPW repeat protein [Sediminimonas sp.]|uniref:SPW repeat protein n=1 Tax=Sediminimonas sp. TaxID=2823379 RepID=UPI00286FF7B4|nr:SPW repeat protein [Sediminimonas sp.]MDR9486053.1 SPW repeat protein [Sediminimonas sp.]
MTEFWKNITEDWQDDLIAVLGAALFVSPWVLGYAGQMAAFGNALIVGAIMVVLALAALIDFREWEEWIGIVLGVWLIASPWILGFTGLVAAMWTAVILGVLTLVLAGWSLYSHGGMSTA